MNTMNITPDQIRAAAKTNLDAIIEITAAQFNAVEKIANLQAVAIKSAFEDTIANVRAAARGLIDDGHCELRLKATGAGPLHVALIGVEGGVFRDRDTLSVWARPGEVSAWDLKWQLAGDQSGVTLVRLPLPATAGGGR